MARTKNSTFSGTPIRDTDVDAPTWTRVLREVQSDLAMIFDRVTGENSETTTINHGGTDGRGALLGMPIVNQGLFRNWSAASFASGGSKNGASGITYLVITPILWVAGEPTLRVEIDLAGVDGYSPRAVLLSSSTGSEVDSADLEDVGVQHGDVQTIGATLSLGSVPSSAALYILAVEVDTTFARVRDRRALAWRAFHPRGLFASVGANAAQRASSASAMSTTVPTPGAAQGLAFSDIDAARFADLLPVDGGLLTKINRNALALEEYLTGWPAGANTTYTHVDHDGSGVADDTDPARSRFLAHTRSLYASEPLPTIPIIAHALGPILADGYRVEDGANGLVDWYAPYSLTTAGTSLRNYTAHRVYLPDLPLSSSTSRLKWAALVALHPSSSTAITTWSARYTTASDSDTQAFTALLGSTQLAIVTGGGTAGELYGGPDTVERHSIGLVCSTTPTDGDISLLGFCLWYEGT